MLGATGKGLGPGQIKTPQGHIYSFDRAWIEGHFVLIEARGTTTAKHMDRVSAIRWGSVEEVISDIKGEEKDD